MFLYVCLLSLISSSTNVLSEKIMASNYSAIEKHEKCRKKVCIICYLKGDRHISQKEFDYIKLNVIYGLSSDNSDFPSGLCNGCQLLLNKQINGHDISLPKVESYDPERPLILRDTLECTCKICTVANTSCFNVKKQNAVVQKATQMVAINWNIL